MHRRYGARRCSSFDNRWTVEAMMFAIALAIDPAGTVLAIVLIVLVILLVLLFASHP